MSGTPGDSRLTKSLLAFIFFLSVSCWLISGASRTGWLPDIDPDRYGRGVSSMTGFELLPLIATILLGIDVIGICVVRFKRWRNARKRLG